jgi:hypothetical protein
MAGSATTTLTFSTDVGGGVTEDSETVNFQHTNPVVFNVTPSPAVGTDIGINATNIVLTATNVNIPWWGRRGTDAADNIPTTVNPFNTPQASDQITVPIPARLWQDASSWTGEILVQAGYGAYNGVSALATPQSFTFNRTPYTLDVDNISPSTLGGFGGNVTMDVTTNAEAYTLRFTGAGTAIDVTENPAQTSTSVTIPANTSSTTRTIEIVNFYDPTTTLASFTQDGTPNYILYGPYATVPAFTLDPPCPTSYSRSNVGLVTGVESTIMLNSTGAAPAVNRYYFTGNEVSGSGRRLMYIDVTNTTPATGQHNLYVTAGTANNPYSATYNGLWYIVCMRDQNP